MANEKLNLSARESAELARVMAEDQQRRWPTRKSAPSMDDYDRQSSIDEHEHRELRFE